MAEPPDKTNSVYDDDAQGGPVIRPSLGNAREREDDKVGNGQGAEGSQLNLGEAEENAGESRVSSADRNERKAAGLNDDNGPGWFKDEGSGKKKSGGKFWTRRRKIGGGITGLILGGSIGFFSIVQGPLQFIHKAQIFQRAHFGRQDNFSDDRSGKFVFYLLAGKAAKGRLGVISNHVADKWETRLNEKAGLKSVYQRGTQRLIGYEIIDGAKARESLRDMDRDNIPRTNSLQGLDINGNPITATNAVDLRDDKFRRRRSVTRTITKSLGVNGVSSALGSRMLTKRGGVNFHPLRNIIRKQADSYADWRQKQKDADANETRTGDPNSPDSPLSSRRKRILTKLKSLANTAKGPAIVAAAVCGIKSFNDSIDAQNYENQLTLMRLGMKRGITIGEQIKSNQDFNVILLGIYDDYHYDEVNGTSWLDDPGVQQEMGKEPTGYDYNKDVKPGSKEKPLVFNFVDNVPDFGVCGLIEDATKLPVIKQGLEAMSAATNAAFGLFGIPTPEELINKGVDYFATGGVDVLAEGAKAGGLENIGIRLAANDQFIADGGRELTDTEAGLVKSAALEAQREEFASASWRERYFDIYDSRSVSARMFNEAPKTRGQLVASLGRLPKAIGNLGTNLLGGSKLRAATATYDYGFPLYGFSLDEQYDTNYENPFANAAYIEDSGKLEQLNSEYGNECFGMTISTNGDLVYSKSPDHAKIPNKCKDTTNTELVKYRFYIKNMVSGHTLACYEGLEESCRQIGFGAGPAVQTASNTAGTSIVGDPYTDSTDVACAAGTLDIGTQTAYSNGQGFEVRLCSLPNLPSSGQADNPGSTYSTPGASGFAIVNSRVSGAWFTLVNDAKTAGINLTASSSFRSMNHQQAICQTSADCIKGGNKFIAQPGYSSHQAGVAIDFNGMGVKGGDTCASRATAPDSAGWKWLYENASRYGFKQYSAEAWHWDAYPSANRCGAP